MIELHDISVAFGNETILDGLTFEIPQGELSVVVGPSGTGKSVLLKIILGLLEPDRGEVIIDGESMTRAGEDGRRQIRAQLGMVFQMAALFDSLTIFDNIAFGMRQRGACDEEHIKERVEQVLGMVALDGIEDKMPNELSGGMRKRVGLARAICYRPRILLYDEPTTGLDPVMTDVITELIIGVHQSTMATSLVVTHDLKSATKLADRMVMLYQGKVYLDCSPEEFTTSADPIVRQFVDGEAWGPMTQGMAH